MPLARRRARVARLICVTVMVAAVIGAVTPSPLAAQETQAVVANDNRRPAGTLEGNILVLSLRAGRGVWHPEGPSGPGLTIEALGETASPLTVPAPIVRVTEGTRIVASLRNDLDTALTVRGLCARDGSACAPLSVPAGETRTVEFLAGQPGTYHYWATAMGAPVPFREMGGAFIVDPPEGSAPDRVLVITEWSSLSRAQLGEIMRADDASEAFVKAQPRFTFVMNGLSWPASERLTYQLGESVRWRVINLSSQHHPMHLHGFYFDVESLGNGLRDQKVAPADRQAVVTQLLRSDATMIMTWTPEREGNWLFHCHIMHHISPERRLADAPRTGGDAHADHANHGAQDASGGMAGMIIGVTVVGGSASPPASAVGTSGRTARRLTLDMARDLDGPESRFGFRLRGDGVTGGAPTDRLSSPGPVLVLRRDEPVEITVNNQLGESTALHWHGMELDSIYDGVHGWSGAGRNLAPMIEPGKSFVVRFTPPRTGTFIYHTHLHDERQLPLGLYGAMIVVDDPGTFDPATDHVLVVARRGLDPAAPNVIIPSTPVVINGETGAKFAWKAGQRHRVRLINITPDDILTVSLENAQGPTTWKPVTKDGAPLPPGLRAAVPARQTIAVGETYDFELDTAPAPHNLWIDVRSTAGKWLAQGRVIVK
jgi:FtsP/CotA-like multicopper oxidase with cupredoxin domain